MLQYLCEHFSYLASPQLGMRRRPVGRGDEDSRLRRGLKECGAACRDVQPSLAVQLHVLGEVTAVCSGARSRSPASLSAWLI